MALIPGSAGPPASVGSFALSVGGAESNVACALRALGVPSAWVSRVGADGVVTGPVPGAAPGMDSPAVRTS